MPNPAAAPIILEPAPHWNKLSKEDEVLLFRTHDGLTVYRRPARSG